MGDSGFGRYELVERIAIRSTSELFLAKVSGEHGFRRQIVVKRLHDDAQAARFIEDAKLSARLSHAKIVQTLELGRVGNAPFVATDYVDGVDLLGLLEELAKRERKLEPSLVMWIAQELLDALDYAHTLADDNGQPLAIVHGRLSPSKVLLGAGGEVKLCDFGVARRFDLEHGDYGHMSPEYVAEQPVDPRSDVFGVGVLIAEMLMGRRLFASSNEFDVLLAVRDVRLDRFVTTGLDTGLVTIVQRALARRPGDRWANAALFRDAIDEWIFAHRCHGMKQTLSALVGDVRAEVDRWRRNGTFATPAFDDVAGRVEKRWTRSSIPPRGVEIPARPARGTPEPTFEDFDIDFDSAEADEIEADIDPRPHPTTPPLDVDGFKVSFKRTSQQIPIIVDMPSERIAHGSSVLPALPADQPPPPTLAELEPDPDDSGELARTPGLRVLFQQMRAKTTGLLAVWSGNVRKDIYIKNGRPQAVWSSDATELFGNYLVAHDVLSEGELAMALATMSHYGGRIGDTLVGLGLLKRVEVFRHLVKHARSRVIDVMTWTEGKYAWYAGKEDAREAFPLEVEGFGLLGEGVMALPQKVVEQWLGRYRDMRVIALPKHQLAADSLAAKDADAVFELIDGSRSVNAIVSRHTDRWQAVRLLYLFVTCDLARLG